MRSEEAVEKIIGHVTISHVNSKVYAGINNFDVFARGELTFQTRHAAADLK